MTQLLERAFSEASKLPDLQQNRLARWLLDELLGEQKWDSLFAESEDFLADLAEEALNEHLAGKTQPLSLNESGSGLALTENTKKFSKKYKVTHQTL